jgi:hypothetical protein
VPEDMFANKIFITALFKSSYKPKFFWRFRANFSEAAIMVGQKHPIIVPSFCWWGR